MKVKEFLAMDNIAGKTVKVKEAHGEYCLHIPKDNDKVFTDSFNDIKIYHNFLNAECEIVVTTVQDFIYKMQPARTYQHGTDKCGWNVYRVAFEFNTGQSFSVSTEDEKELEQEVCRAINQKFNLDLEPSNLDFLK